MSTSAPPSTRSPAIAWIIRMLASVGGLGYLPLAPGTWGSLAGLPLVLGLASLTPTMAFFALVALTLASIGIAQAAEGAFSASHDAKEVVLDEVVGMGWTFWCLPVTPAWLGAGFVLFRLLDALKPGPIGTIDRRVPGGAGVVLDDVAAGLVACGLLHLSGPYLSPWLGG